MAHSCAGDERHLGSDFELFAALQRRHGEVPSKVENFQVKRLLKYKPLSRDRSVSDFGAEVRSYEYRSSVSLHDSIL
jgi:hypothetical protein